MQGPVVLNSFIIHFLTGDIFSWDIMIYVYLYTALLLFSKGLKDLIPGLKSLIISAPAEFHSKS